jgi:hypothetical protein
MRAERSNPSKAICSLILGALVLFASPPVSPADSGESEVRKLKQEIERLKAENEANRMKMEEFEKKLEQLEVKSEEKQKQIDQLQTKTEEKQKEIAAEVSKGPSPEVLRRVLGSYWGDGRFMITGYGFGEYDWDQNSNSNTFTAGFNPVFLFRLNDWILFQSELEVKLPSEGETETNLEFANADIFLNKYTSVVAGKFLLPFGDFIERLHPPWIDKLVSHPLPLREGDDGGLLPFSDIGVQFLRGAVPLSGPGTSFEYTAWMGNGPSYESEELGSNFTSNNIDSNRNKAFGARFAVYPLPIDAGLGRLGVGASTFDGKWDSGGNLWFRSWGLNGLYQLAQAELRGEYINTQRDLPSTSEIPHDNRSGWYIQGAYSLSQVPIPYVSRVELVARYSRQDQRAVTSEDYVPHPRQVSVGFDYWLTPSVAFKFEYDRDLPESAPNDNEIRTQLAVGF